tara:strand:- start:231 stop:2093 length:1863 start_codon:yes stop_codon:yes gene_type:complete
MANQVDIVINAKDNASRAIGNASGKVDQLSNKLKSMRLPIMAVTTAIVGLGAVSLKNASDLSESMNAVSVVFQDATSQINRFGESAAQEVGLSQEAFNELATVTGSLLKDFGLTLDESAEQTIRLALRASDLASVFNTEVKDAMSAINAALRGETEAIRRYGISFDDAALKTKAMAMGLDELDGVISRSDKSLAALELIMEKSADVQGDFKNTSDQLANSQRILKAEFANASAELGQNLLPIATAFMQKLLGLIEAFNGLSSGTQKAIVNFSAITVGMGAFLLILPTLIASVKALASAFIFLNAVNPFILIGVAVAALIVAIVGIATKWDWFSQKFRKQINFMAELLEGFLQVLVNSFVNPLILLWNKLVQMFPKLGKPIDLMVVSLGRIPKKVKETTDQFSLLSDEMETTFGEFKKIEKTEKIFPALTHNITEMDLALQDASLSGRAFVETQEEDIRGLVRSQKIAFDAIVRHRQQRIDDELRMEQEKADETLRIAQENADKLVQAEKDKQVALRQAENMFATEMANAIRSAEFTLGQKTFGSGNMYLGGDRSRILTSAGRRAWHEGTLQTGGRTSRHDTMANPHWVIAPELQGQISVNRVSTNLREKQGDFTSGIGNL